MGREWLGAEARLLILATDMNPEYLKQARQGVYPAGSLREVPAEMRALFMKCPGVDLYEIPSFIRQDLLWAPHDLRTGPAGRAFDLIFLRNNLLTYETLHHQETETITKLRLPVELIVGLRLEVLEI